MGAVRMLTRTNAVSRAESATDFAASSDEWKSAERIDNRASASVRILFRGRRRHRRKAAGGEVEQQPAGLVETGRLDDAPIARERRRGHDAAQHRKWPFAASEQRTRIDGRWVAAECFAALLLVFSLRGSTSARRPSARSARARGPRSTSSSLLRGARLSRRRSPCRA